MHRISTEPTEPLEPISGIDSPICTLHGGNRHFGSEGSVGSVGILGFTYMARNTLAHQASGNDPMTKTRERPKTTRPKVTRVQWGTVVNNFMSADLLRGMLAGRRKSGDSLRIVFAEGGGGPSYTDIAYVVPCDDNRGNTAAALIAASPELLAAVESLLPLARDRAHSSQNVGEQFTVAQAARLLASLHEKGV